ncbi:patatin-like phospholipase family protein [Sulfurospirillum arsenophilum]|uniref:patatin-like phospholipase family protein n=1 Tax=Sulfurospirillum arsenophilum TaxID=56698 RepID=UPI0018DD8FB1|nr:patatin-like phospholipase family protein [Sulfurospirillum arsenophilum]
MKPKLGIVLSGGGAKGAYEAGFLKALAEFNIQPHAIAGTSIGALNGAIYSANINTSTTAVLIEKIWQDMGNSNALQFDKKKVFINLVEVITYFSPLAPVSKLAKFVQGFSVANSKKGLLTTRPIENILEKYAPLHKLKKGLPFYIGLTKSHGNMIDILRLFEIENLGSTNFKKVQLLNEKDIYNAILASAALPIAFDAIKVDGTYYRDGCLGSINNEWGNTPAHPLITEEKCTHIIVCHLNEGSFFNRHDPLFKDIAIIEIRPQSNTFSSILDPLAFDVSKIDLWIEQGYTDSKKILSESLEALNENYQRITSEIQTDLALEKLKIKKFSIPDE